MENQNSAQVTNINMRATVQEKELLLEQAKSKGVDLTNYLKTQLFEELPRLRNYEKAGKSRDSRLAELERELKERNSKVEELEEALSYFTFSPSLNKLFENSVGKVCNVGGKTIEINSKADLVEALSLNFKVI
jgi:predicted RNase H-like nuclease (RuvC/YqgF family)